ncbi:DUF3017 domain-containing protein [Acidipropionibacterium timonense]|uniref:DUF3017 domain-containing protein n=1 Tax=Acidipropionibacterium timonense TaxID=2161818 RepID=UPI001AEC2ED5|nr:DUF3017 domain-containing protein [Acidipropionibacterium timonense]
MARVREAPQRIASPWALVVCLVGVAVSAGIIATGHWRRGSMAFACSVLLAGLLRLVLPARMAGLLVVRRRWVDCTVLLGLGLVMTGLVLVVPPSH